MAPVLPRPRAEFQPFKLKHYFKKATFVRTCRRETEGCQDAFCGIHAFSVYPGFEKAKISSMRHLDDVVRNGKMMFVGTNMSGHSPCSP